MKVILFGIECNKYSFPVNKLSESKHLLHKLIKAAPVQVIDVIKYPQFPHGFCKKVNPTRKLKTAAQLLFLDGLFEVGKHLISFVVQKPWSKHYRQGKIQAQNDTPLGQAVIIFLYHSH